MNPKQSITSRLNHQLLALAFAGICSSPASWAAPTGAFVTHGQAGFSSQGNTLTITNSPGTIINWQSFSIAPLEITRFVQEGSHSAVLNRVIGSGRSEILGSLLSNGKVYLINPNGIVFGAGARVDVAGLIASSLHLSDQDFLAGRLKFIGNPDSGVIENHGTLNTPDGGRIYLIAPRIENNGIINTPNGEILLAAGHQVSLVDGNNPDLHVIVSAPEDMALNLGHIIAAGGRIGIHAALLQQSGRISADSAVQGEGGRIFLKASRHAQLDAGSTTTARGNNGGQIRVEAAGDTRVAGEVAVSGTQGSGGSVHLLGNRVAVETAGNVDASGPLGGGEILVGGDYRGENPAIRNASQTRLDSGARLTADATLQGDGGKVIVWGNETTLAHGEISTRGGPRGGNGGFVETSAKYLYTQGARVDTRAPLGKTGMWLLDPIDVVIMNTASDPNATFTGGTWATTSTVTNSIIFVGDLQTQLGLSNVTIDSSAGAPSGSASPGSITVQNPIAWSSGNSLTLKSDGEIIVNATISGGTGGLNVQAGDDISINANISAAQISFTTSASLGVTGTGQAEATGSISITSTGNMSLPGTVDPTTFSTTAGAGKLSAPQIKLYATAGDITATNASISYTGGDLRLEASGNISLSQSVIYADDLKLYAEAGISQSMGYITATSLWAEAGGYSGTGINLPSNNSVGTFGGKVSQNSIAFTNNGNLTLNGITTQGGNVTISTTGNLNNQAPGINACGSAPSCMSAVSLSSSSGSITTALIKAGEEVSLTPYYGDIIDGDGSANNIVSGGANPVSLYYSTYSGNVDLDAWGAVIRADSLATTANIRTSAPPPPPPPPPTLDQCVADPSLSGCGNVLPTLESCTTSPEQQGCSVVLPSLDTCTAAPTTPGCTAVLPTLETCTATPVLPGCAVVLPSLDTCTAAPTTPGCTAVLPKLETCTATPALPGCSAVLPSLDTCTAAPTMPGCTVILPLLTDCTADPLQAGCSVVLPTISDCSTNPSQAGCTAVIPPSQLIQLESQQQTNLVQANNQNVQGCNLAQSGLTSPDSPPPPGSRRTDAETALASSNQSSTTTNGEQTNAPPAFCN